MEEMQEKDKAAGDYYIGLDIGTDSVGIACTDPEYGLMRAKGKDLWAVRLFDEAKTAKERRVKRAARRRLQRRARRIDLLQEIFLPFIDDEMFFLRLNNSGYRYEDKSDSLGSANSLFFDENFTDKDFYKKYPTVFHLRRALIRHEEKADSRLYYLALHHIIKYRGHFLFEGDDVGDIRDIRKLIVRFCEIAAERFDENAPFISEENAEKFKEIALRPFGLNDKKKECKQLFGDGKLLSEAVVGMLGGKIRLSEIFGDEKYKEEKSFSFRDIAEDEYEALEQTLGDDFEYLDAIKSVYDFLTFEKVLGGNEYISDAMVKIYEKHKQDLRTLKDFIIARGSHEKYKEVFKSIDTANNYAAYVGYTKKGGKKIKVNKKCKDRNELYKYLEKVVSQLKTENDALARALLDEIASGNFLPKILNSDNGRFPRQINEAELDAILVNLQKDFPLFDGGAADKVKKIFRYRIPYYVGPLGKVGDNVWAVRKKEGKITPWNFDEMVDRAASNENFMRRMTGKCSYLYGENTLPKHSILYQKFNTLNQINKLTVNGEPISVELKKTIYEELFLKYRRVTVKAIRALLAEKGLIAKSEESGVSIGGADGEFNATMSSYITLKSILGDFVDKNIDACEDIILWHTLNTDKNIVEHLIARHYGNVPEIADNIKRLKGISSFKDFGNLSKKFLCEIRGAVDYETGEVWNILDTLYNTNNNLMQILNDDRYEFKKKIDEENGETGDVDYDTLKEMGLNPQVRRGVWQALKMTDEYVSAVGRAPSKIFVEVTRGGGEKGKRTVSRKRQLEAIYKDAEVCRELIDKLNGKTDSELRGERLYLYFLQLGKCAYTGEQISLDELNGDLYDVDHILPRSLIKDDGIDNKVLVKRVCNAAKSDVYPVPSQYRQEKLWKIWKDKKLISEKKYALLTRTAELSEKDFEDFVARQLVVTGQMSKAVAELLNMKYGNDGTKIVYSKGSNVSEFRNKYGLVKCRETNDLHHAADAYLNIAVGNVYDTKFSGARSYYRKDENDAWRQYNLKKLFDRDVAGAWDAKTSLSKVKGVLRRKTVIVTRMAFTGKGEFYNETVYGKDEKAQYPRKKGGQGSPSPLADVGRYGGYKSPCTAYFAVVSSLGKKDKPMKTIEAIPVIVDYESKTDPLAVERYLTEERGLKEPKLLVEKIKIKTLMKINGTPVWIAGTQPGSILIHNAVQWYTDGETDAYVKAVFKLLDMKKQNMLSESEQQDEEFAINTNRLKQDKIVVKRESNILLFEKIVAQLSKNLYQGLSAMRSFREKLNSHRGDFEKLSVLKQAETLAECVKFLKCNASPANLEHLREGKRCGILQIGQNIADMGIEIVYISECGLTERKVRI